LLIFNKQAATLVNKSGNAKANDCEQKVTFDP
jgi:hypothetical protein